MCLKVMKCVQIQLRGKDILEVFFLISQSELDYAQHTFILNKVSSNMRWLTHVPSLHLLFSCLGMWCDWCLFTSNIPLNCCTLHQLQFIFCFIFYWLGCHVLHIMNYRLPRHSISWNSCIICLYLLYSKFLHDLSFDLSCYPPQILTSFACLINLNFLFFKTTK